MPRISKSRLNRIDSRLTQRQGQPEDLATYIERMATSDFECFERFSALARAMAHEPQNEALHISLLDAFFDRVAIVEGREYNA
jgi:hypothetical protein